MLGLTMVRLIETHSQELTESLVAKLRNSQRTTSYRTLPAADLKNRVEDVYQHLGEWLLSKTESDIELRYTEAGEHRAQQGIPLTEFFWALILSKETLLSFLRANVFAERAIELFGELEFMQALEQFFDHAAYYSMVGYERAGRAQRPAA